MKAHKYWSVGALITMFGTYYTGYKKLKSSHKYFALSSMLCMVMAIWNYRFFKKYVWYLVMLTKRNVDVNF